MPLNSGNIPELYQPNIKRFLAWIVLACVLVGSWHLCGSQCCTFKHDHSLRISLWNQIDLHAFRFFNRWLLTRDHHTFIARIFVVLNSIVIGEVITNLTLVLLTSLIFTSKHLFPRQTRSLKVSVVLAMIIYGMIGQMVLSKLSRDYLCPKRPSPSIVFRFSTVNPENQAISSSSDPFSINRLFEEAKKRDLVKEIAHDSWPGEHAAVNLIWALFMSTIIARASLSRTKQFFLHSIVWLIALLFCIARLVSGAHWFSDCFAGGLSEALVVVAIGVYTPVLQIFTKAIHWLVSKPISNEKKLP